MIRMGASAGLVLRKVGGFGMSFGSCPPAALIASSTSFAAASMLRLRSNCSVIWLVPITLTEVICDRPGICPNWVSSGVATAVAIVCGLAPGYWALTDSVGNSTEGSGATGRNGYAASPARKIATTISDVAIGRSMNGRETFIAGRPACLGLAAVAARAARRARARRPWCWLPIRVCPATTTRAPSSSPLLTTDVLPSS